MTNKFVVIINSLKIPKIKKIVLYEMKFLVPNYSCLQNPWIGGYRPQIRRSLCPQLNLVPKIKKILLDEMEFLVPNYSCLQNPWPGGLSPPDPRSLCPKLNLLNIPRKKIPGYATGLKQCAQQETYQILHVGSYCPLTNKNVNRRPEEG
jgi:hypothetical protein